MYLPRQNCSNTWKEGEGSIFWNEELEGSGPNRDWFSLANLWDKMSDLIETDVMVYHENGCCRHIVESGSGELDQGVREFEGRVDTGGLARQLEFSKNGNTAETITAAAWPPCQDPNKLNDKHICQLCHPSTFPQTIGDFPLSIPFFFSLSKGFFCLKFG